MADFMWDGAKLDTIRDLLDGASKAQREGRAQEFLAAYRAVNEHADQNIGYILGYVEPPERRRELYEAFTVTHPVFGAHL